MQYLNQLTWDVKMFQTFGKTFENGGINIFIKLIIWQVQCHQMGKLRKIAWSQLLNKIMADI